MTYKLGKCPLKSDNYLSTLVNGKATPYLIARRSKCLMDLWFEIILRKCEVIWKLYIVYEQLYVRIKMSYGGLISCIL